MSVDGVSRREAILRIGLTAAAGWTGAIATAEPPSAEAGDLPLDDALRSLHREEPRCRQGLSTHAPMAAEALCALGFAAKVAPWVAGYDRPLLMLPAPGRPVMADRWREALGPRVGLASWEESNARWGDWREFFTAEIEARGWRGTLDPWVARLAPGMSGAATHGVIRTAHAVRALGRKETPERRAELARGLAYWASSYEELPARSGVRPRAGVPGVPGFTEALAEIPLYRQAFGRTPEGRNIVEQIRHVREMDRFADVRDLVLAPPDLSKALSALTATFARVYLRHGAREHTIAFVHAVTGPASLRRIALHVSPQTAGRALPYAWQTAAAIYAAYAPEHGLGRGEESRLTPDELAALAVANGDEHAIKFTEVMLAEHAINPDPVYLAAAEDVTRRL